MTAQVGSGPAAVGGPDGRSRRRDRAVQSDGDALESAARLTGGGGVFSSSAADADRARARRRDRAARRSSGKSPGPASRGGADGGATDRSAQSDGDVLEPVARLNRGVFLSPAVDADRGRPRRIERVGMMSLHTSPISVPGQGDAGGMNVYLRAVAGALARQGVEVELYTRAGTDSPGAVELEPGVRLHRLAVGPPGELPKSQLPALAPEASAALAALPPVDILHSHYWISGLAALPVARQWGVAHVQSFHTVASLKNHNLAPGDAPEPPERLTGERMLAEGSDLIIAASQAERAAITEDYDIGDDFIRVVPPGVDMDRFHPGPGPDLSTLSRALRRLQYGPRPDDAVLARALRRPRGYLLMIGRVQPLKGQDLAIRALGQIAPERRPALVISGAPSGERADYAAHLRSLVRQLGLTKDVVFIDAQDPDRLADLIRGGRLTLMPSHSETYGLVAVESAACGVPVIAAHTSGLRTSVADGVSGILVPGRDPAEWAAAILRVLDNPALAARLRRGAIEFARPRSWEAAASSLLDSYAAARCLAGLG